MIMNYTFIKKQSILSLFKVTSSTEDKVKKISFFQMIIGALGIVLILTGYYVLSSVEDVTLNKDKILCFLINV